MRVLDNLQARIDAIMSPIYTSTGQLVPRQMSTPAEVRLYITEITQVQKSLRMLKTEVTNESKQTSAQFNAQKWSVSSHPMQALFEGKKGAMHHTAFDKYRIQQNKTATLQNYRQATTHIDQYIQILENLKIDMKRQMT